MIRVLVVEDSPTAKELLVHILSSDPAIEVVGTAASGIEALAAVETLRPSLITMDVHMPQLNGLDATRQIMERRPTPIVIVSGTMDFSDTATAFRALECGALAVLQRPLGFGNPDFHRTAAELIRTVKLMAEVKVITRRRHDRLADEISAPNFRAGLNASAIATHAPTRIVAIGASTGGPPVLQAILSQLPGGFPVPLAIVQHIAAGFNPALAEWLGLSSPLPIHLPGDGETALPGHVYLAPDDHHMAVTADNHIHLRPNGQDGGVCPSVSHLFRSVAREFGPGAIGVLLSGMGKDGACELKLMKDYGAITIAQDRETSVVHGMPGEAIRLGAATYILPAEKIGGMLCRLVAEPLFVEAFPAEASQASEALPDLEDDRLSAASHAALTATPRDYE